MAPRTDKKTNNPLPLNTEDTTPSSNITYNNEVVAIIAGLAANEVEGIAGMCSVSGGIMGKNRNITKGVKVEVGTEEVAVDLYVIVEYGIPIQRAAADAQENVRKAIESMTGLHVVRVDVHVQSVSFEQDKKALQAGAQQAALAAGEVETVKLPEVEKPAPAAEPVKTPVQEKTAEKPAAEAPAAKEEPKPEMKEEPKPAAAEEPKSKPKTEKAPKAKPAASGGKKPAEKKTGKDTAAEA